MDPSNFKAYRTAIARPHRVIILVKSFNDRLERDL